MKVTYSFLIIIIFFIVGCKGKAVEYNNKIIQLETELGSEVTKAEDKIGQYYSDQEFEKMAKEAKKMEKKINDKIKTIKDDPAPDVEGAPQFKKSALKYFTYMKKVYTGYTDIANADNEEDRDEARKNLLEFLEQKETVVADFLKSQKKFASQNNLRLESEENTADNEEKPKKKKKKKVVEDEES